MCCPVWLEGPVKITTAPTLKSRIHLPSEASPGFCLFVVHTGLPHQEHAQGLLLVILTSLGCSLPFQPATICPCRFATQVLKPSQGGRWWELGRGLESSRRSPG